MTSNTMDKVREAFNNIGNACAWVAENCNDQQTAKYMNDVIAMVQAALSLPRRQCDVGTAEEQAERYEAFCDSQKCDCIDCPVQWRASTRECPFTWSQMPYEAEQKGEGHEQHP